MRHSEEARAERLDCLVQITWPAGRNPWWSVRHIGTRIQVAAALDELALRIDIDHWTHLLSALDHPLVGYDLTLRRTDTAFVIDHAADTVPIDTMSAILHTHATVIRSHLPA
ncbi:hypothetical protein [Nocardia paucivorans]|uniref:hypothetical protein n=1 Tax=Nocardia paucivorans TaxID=114259 RepID=UPI0012F7EBE2|nr:hypothetical protein [Nocardia paucivorans]